MDVGRDGYADAKQGCKYIKIKVVLYAKIYMDIFVIKEGEIYEN